MYSGGNSAGTYAMCAGAINYDTPLRRIYFNQWGTNDLYYHVVTDTSYNNSKLPNGTIIADCYTGSGTGALTGGRKFYINNSLLTTNLGQGAATSARAQTSGNNYIGHATVSFADYTGTLAYFYWSNSELTSPDIILLGST